jgi:hypothetical protein
MREQLLRLEDPSAAPGMRSKRPESARKQENQRLIEEIQLIHKQSRETGSQSGLGLRSMEVPVFTWI